MDIDIDEADFGIWLEQHIHRRNSYSYNNLWYKFFERYDFAPEKLDALNLQTACDYISEIGRKW